MKILFIVEPSCKVWLQQSTDSKSLDYMVQIWAVVLFISDRIFIQVI